MTPAAARTRTLRRTAPSCGNNRAPGARRSPHEDAPAGAPWRRRVRGEFAELIARTVLDNLYRFVVPALAGPARLVPLVALESPQVSRVALRNAAQRGRIRAQPGHDGQWPSSRVWVDEYLANRNTRRPAPPDSTA